MVTQDAAFLWVLKSIVFETAVQFQGADLDLWFFIGIYPSQMSATLNKADARILALHGLPGVRVGRRSAL